MTTVSGRRTVEPDASVKYKSIAMRLSRLAEPPRLDNGEIVFEFTPDTPREDAQRSVERVLDETLSGWRTWLAVSGLQRAGLRAHTNCAQPRTCWRMPTRPRAASASVISSRENMCAPVSTFTSGLVTPAGRGPLLQLESSASRPVGASTRTSSSTACIGCSIRYSAAKQQTALKLASLNGSAPASPRT